MRRVAPGTSSRENDLMKEKNGGLVLSERFDHIDGHFTGKGGLKCNISDWKSIELEPLQDTASYTI